MPQTLTGAASGPYTCLAMESQRILPEPGNSSQWAATWAASRAAISSKQYNLRCHAEAGIQGQLKITHSEKVKTSFSEKAILK
jgi:hypothetical protein